MFAHEQFRISNRPHPAMQMLARATEKARRGGVACHRHAPAGLLGFLVLPISPASAQPNGQTRMWGHMPYAWQHMMGWEQVMLGGLRMLVFWGIIVVISLLLGRAFMGIWASRSPRPRQTALDILQERYAKGDIDEEEFNKRKTNLSK